jgi:hypothetical protein
MRVGNSTTGAPPVAATRIRGLFTPVGANRMTPSAFHVPPFPLVTGAGVCGAPPPRSSRVNVDFPLDLPHVIDREAQRIGVNRQAFIKLRPADALTAKAS